MLLYSGLMLILLKQVVIYCIHSLRFDCLFLSYSKFNFQVFVWFNIGDSQMINRFYDDDSLSVVKLFSIISVGCKNLFYNFFSAFVTNIITFFKVKCTLHCYKVFWNLPISFLIMMIIMKFDKIETSFFKFKTSFKHFLKLLFIFVGR